jgi:hypothetical protein
MAQRFMGVKNKLKIPLAQSDKMLQSPVMSQTTTEKAIVAFGKSLRGCNRCPVESGEEITNIKRIVGQDGVERELITVKELKTNLPKPGCRNMSSTFRIYGKGTLSLQAGLRKGHGYGQGIVTDGKCYRYVG